MTLFGYLRIEDYLGNAGPVPQVDKYQLAVVTAAVYPTCKCDFGTFQVLF
jgi:hypothetical protein